MLLGNLQTLLSPDGIDGILANFPAFLLEEIRDGSISIAAILRGDLKNAFLQLLLAQIGLRFVPLRSSDLPNDSACSPLADGDHLADMLNGFPFPRRA